jgi:hypothetical protein
LDAGHDHGAVVVGFFPGFAHALGTTLDGTLLRSEAYVGSGGGGGG